MQKAISNKIQLGDTFNPLKDYAGVPSINEGNLENLIQKVDQVGEFWKTGKADGDLPRYFPNIIPVTRQALRILIKSNYSFFWILQQILTLITVVWKYDYH